MTTTSHPCIQTSQGAALNECDDDLWSFPSLFILSENGLELKTFPLIQLQIATQGPCAVSETALPI